MNEQASKLDKIKDLNKQISSLENMIDDIKSVSQKFKKTFNKSLGKAEIDIIKNRINEIKKEIKSVFNGDVSDNNNLLDIESVTSTVISAWGRKDITTSIKNYDENDEELKNSCDFEIAQSVFNRSLGMNVSLDDITFIKFYADTDSRSEIWLVRVYLIKGFGFAFFDTGRVNWSTDVLTNEDFLKEIEDEITKNI